VGIELSVLRTYEEVLSQVEERLSGWKADLEVAGMVLETVKAQALEVVESSLVTRRAVNEELKRSLEPWLEHLDGLKANAVEELDEVRRMIEDLEEGFELVGDRVVGTIGGADRLAKELTEFVRTLETVRVGFETFEEEK